ncbi:MAG: PadR family transcriptional regulator [Micromonosporaceae bacterium]
MQEPTFLVLAALATETLHGYGLIQAVADLSGGKVELRAGTLYPALDRLTDAGLVDLDREEVVEGRLRRYYRLTDAGADRLAEETQRLRRNADAASTRLATRADAARAAKAAVTGANRPRRLAPG